MNGRALKKEGHVVEGLTEEQAAGVVRCEIGDGVGQGFFVCVFERDPVVAMKDAERKKREKEFKKELEGVKEDVQEGEGEIAPTRAMNVIVPKTGMRKNGMKKNVFKVGREVKKDEKKDKKGKNEKVVVDYVAKARMGKMGKKGKKVPLGQSL